MSIRTEQIASTLRHAIQRVISRDLNDPRIRGLVSITNIDVSPDLSEAVVLVSILPQRHERLTMTALHHAAKKIRAQIARSVRLRAVPRLTFRLDQSLKKQAALEAAIRGTPAEARADDEQINGKETDEPGVRRESES